VSLDDLPVGRIRAVSDHACVARLDDGRLVAFGRRCPHQGSDLATGSIRDGLIVCSGHNLMFDSRNGAVPCATVPSLRILPCDVRDGRLVLPGRARD
jgi:nitrite reductase/ring-hydroxylating ferredoxin subunit